MTIEEALAVASTGNAESLQTANSELIIDDVSRTIYIPDSEKIFGVESDENTDRKYFRCPRIVGDNIDLSKLQICINYQNASGENSGRDIYICDDVKVDGDDVTFSWQLSRKVTLYKGTIYFVVCAKKASSDGMVTNEWNTTLASGRVLEGLEPSFSQSQQAEATDYLIQLEMMLSNFADAKKEEIESKKQEVISSIPEDYGTLSTDVDRLKQDLGDITQIDKSSNILEITDYTEGRYYSASSGDYRYNNNFFTVDNYVEVEPSSSYVLSEFVDGVFEKLLNSIIIFYDKNKKYLSGGQYSTFTTSENANYIRISPNKDALKKQLLLEKGTEPSKIWTPYYKGLYLKGEKIINFLYENIKNKPTINGVEISGNKTSKDYGIPDVPEITETYNLYKTNEITVDVNGSGDFEKLQDAIKSITSNSENNRFTIYIKEGEYDLAEGIADDENDSSVIGLTIPNWVTLKGLGNRENVILKAKFINKKQYVSTLNFNETGAIENLTVTGENTRYVIHDDFAREANGYKRSVKHCILKGITTYYSTVYGAGTGDGADWEFEDVIFDGSQVGANSKPANTFTVHNVLASQKNRNIVFKNCIFVSTNERNVKFKTLAYRTSTGADNANNMLTNVSLYGCKFDGTSKGFELVEENPDVYGKGCYYFVNGYGNINAGYEITTTDNKDYSNRVNLIGKIGRKKIVSYNKNSGVWQEGAFIVVNSNMDIVPTANPSYAYYKLAIPEDVSVVYFWFKKILKASKVRWYAFTAENGKALAPHIDMQKTVSSYTNEYASISVPEGAKFLYVTYSMDFYKDLVITFDSVQDFSKSTKYEELEVVDDKISDTVYSNKKVIDRFVIVGRNI